MLHSLHNLARALDSLHSDSLYCTPSAAQHCARCSPLLPLQIPHYHLQKATEAVKPIMGDYYREPEKSPGPIPTHLFEPLRRSFARDHFVDNTGDIVFYQQDKNLKL